MAFNGRRHHMRRQRQIKSKRTRRATVRRRHELQQKTMQTLRQAAEAEEKQE